jgi:hypothetical protein
MWPRGLAACIGEIKHRGDTHYGDWIDATDVCDPFATKATWPPAGTPGLRPWPLPMEHMER